MKRWLILGVGFFLLLMIIFTFKIAEKGNPVGEATSQETSLNVTVFQVAPTLEIISPKNNTYIIKDNIRLNFTSNYATNFWFKIDSGDNTPINSSTYFNTSSGTHTLTLYANNSNSTVSKNVTFTVTPNLFKIKDKNYEEDDDPDEDEGNMSRVPKKGETTDFLDYSYEEFQGLNNLILHQPNSGKIKFNEEINLTDTLDKDDELDLNVHTNISFNRIEINTTALPNFNKSATLTFYNLSFVNPRILKDGEVCSSECSIESYSNGILSFNVNGFSVYSSEETPSSTGTGQATSGGSNTKTLENFTLEPERTSIELKQGAIKEFKINIKNTGDKKLSISALSKDIDAFVRTKTPFFELNIGEEKNIIIEIIAPENRPVGEYIGKIIFKSENLEKEIIFSVEVESPKPLFDVSLEIFEDDKEIFPGQELSSRIEIFNLGEVKKADVEIEYLVKSLEGEIIATATETAAIDTKASFIKKISIPKNTPLGDYILYAKVSYNGQIASSSEWFYIISEQNQESKKTEIHPIILLILLIIIGVIIAILLELHHKKRKKK